MHFPELQFDYNDIYYEGNKIHLTFGEMLIFKAMYEREDKFAHHELLMQYTTSDYENSIKVYIHKMRKKLKLIGIDVQNIWGEGYRLIYSNGERKMTRDEIIRRCIEEEEGGWKYTDHPDDPDQGTYAGVRYITWKNYIIRHNINEFRGITPAGFKPLAEQHDSRLQTHIIEIYEDDFWDKLHLDEIPEYLRPMILSCGVNIGTKRAAEFLQRVINEEIRNMNNTDEHEIIAEDGVVGPQTYSAAQIFLTANTGLKRKEIAIRFFYHWQSYYNKIVMNNANAWRTNAKQGRYYGGVLRTTFLQGWFNRAFKFIQEVE